MSNENETVADVIRDVEETTHRVGAFFTEGVMTWMRRIEAAHKREMERLAVPTPEQWTEIARQGSELADLKRENKRLREALTQVLECDESSMVCFKDAVHAAKRIALIGGTK